MGLSAFNRARRSRKEVEKFEAKRFEEDNKNRWEGNRLRNPVHDQERVAKDQERSRKLELQASAEIGKKTEEGIKMAEAGGLPDLPLRQDHAAEIAGRNLSGVQTPVPPTERLDERVPASTANEQIVENMSVESKGPSKAKMEAVRKEFLTDPEREAEAQAKRAKDPTPNAAPLDHDADGKNGGAVTDEQVAAAKSGTQSVEAAKTADTKSPAEQQKQADKTAEASRTSNKTEALPAAGKSAGAGKEASSSTSTTKK